MKRSPRGEFVESRGFSRGHSADPHYRIGATAAFGTWIHPLTQVVLTANGRQQSQQQICHMSSYTKLEIHQVSDTISGKAGERRDGQSSSAATPEQQRHTMALGSLSLTELRKAWTYARINLQAHVRAITTDQYISQLRIRSNRGLPPQPCAFYGAQYYDRAHEWSCMALRTNSLPHPDLLFATLGWPRPGSQDDRLVLFDLAAVRKKVLAHRHSP